MSDLGRDLGHWIGRGIIETTEDLTDAFVDVPAAAPAAAPSDSSNKPAAPAPPKPSASWSASRSRILRRVASSRPPLSEESDVRWAGLARHQSIARSAARPRPKSTGHHARLAAAQSGTLRASAKMKAIFWRLRRSAFGSARKH